MKTVSTNGSIPPKNKKQHESIWKRLLHDEVLGSVFYILLVCSISMKADGASPLNQQQHYEAFSIMRLQIASSVQNQSKPMQTNINHPATEVFPVVETPIWSSWRHRSTGACNRAALSGHAFGTRHQECHASNLRTTPQLTRETWKQL